ncbi:hypothetical protein AB5J72_15775 [Streptomyces sp. CG1]|uniref:hypothetical protein n=1 Tax=Streptomyces sp. CG1 TaxID=1287523 RepID=UPI0034E2CCFD
MALVWHVLALLSEAVRPGGDQPYATTRLFAVRINEEFAQEGARILARFRELANGFLAVNDPDAIVQNTNSAFRRETTELDGLSEPLRTARRSLYSLLLQTAQPPQITLLITCGPLSTTSS